MDGFIRRLGYCRRERGHYFTGLNPAALSTVIASPEGVAEWNKQNEDVAPLALFLALPRLDPPGKSSA